MNNSATSSSLNSTSTFSEPQLGDMFEVVLHTQYINELKSLMQSIICNLDNQLFVEKEKAGYFPPSAIYELAVLASGLLFLAGAVSIVIEKYSASNQFETFDSIPNGIKYFIAAAFTLASTSLYKYQEKTKINQFFTFKKLKLNLKNILNLINIYQDRFDKFLKHIPE